MSAAAALQKAMFDALKADPGLAGLLGGAHIFDGQQVRGPLPAVSFSGHQSDDWSTASEDGEEHIVSLDIHSDKNGKAECQQIAAALRAVLHDTSLDLEGHVLVNLRVVRTRFVREKGSRRHRATVEFRVVTEPA